MTDELDLNGLEYRIRNQPAGDPVRLTAGGLQALIAAARERDALRAALASAERLLYWCKMRLRPEYRSLFDRYRSNPLKPRYPNEPPFVLPEAAAKAAP